MQSVYPGVRSVSSPPAVEPFDLAELKEHLRVDHSYEDDLLTLLITAARDFAEKYLGRALITQTLVCYLDHFPGSSVAILLPRPPLQSVTTVQYIDNNGDLTTWASANYDVDIASEPGRILPAYSVVYPTERTGIVNPVTITYVAGYGDAASAIPETIITAMKMIIGNWYEHREYISLNTTPHQIPWAAKALLDQYRIERFDVS